MCSIYTSEIILWMGSASERRRYKLTSFLIGCAHTQDIDDGQFFTGINFWPVPPQNLETELLKILEPLHPSLTHYAPGTCWSPVGRGLTIESYITLESPGPQNHTSRVNVTLQNVIGCHPGHDFQLLAVLFTSPSTANVNGDLETAPHLTMRSCDSISSKTENDVTTCEFSCFEEINEELSPSGFLGYGLRLRSLEALGTMYGVCDIIGWNTALSLLSTCIPIRYEP